MNYEIATFGKFKVEISDFDIAYDNFFYHRSKDETINRRIDKVKNAITNLFEWHKKMPAHCLTCLWFDPCYYDGKCCFFMSQEEQMKKEAEKPNNHPEIIEIAGMKYEIPEAHIRYLLDLFPDRKKVIRDYIASMEYHIRTILDNI